MTGKPIGRVRRAQLITTYGVGSLIAIGSESFMVAGIDRWSEPGSYDQIIHERRLQRELVVDRFRLPPASDNDRYGDIPAVRFPEIQSCPGCHRLAEARFFGAVRSPATCKQCDVQLVPSRFVACCTAGHIDDFPYFRWLHKGGGQDAALDVKHELKLKAKGRSASLGDIEISCKCGVRPVTMEGALSKGALRGISSCTGRRPWLGDVPREQCDALQRAMQRGASGVWFADVRSALSIPPWSRDVQKLVERNWKALRKAPDLRDRIEELELANRRFGVEEIMQAVEHRRRDEEGDTDTSEAALKHEEYRALVRGAAEESGSDFVCTPWIDAAMAEELDIDLVMRVKRLREVRVLRGFTRLAAPNTVTPNHRSPLHADRRPDWLPAIEVIGEGVFLRLKANNLASWESRPVVRSRVEPIDQAYRDRMERMGLAADREITPRLVMIHTLAHAVIAEWSLDSGYPAASLRERLYVSDEMCGVLLYTATSDAAGSLGGIVAQVESGNLASSIRAAVDRIAWCSADPLCAESEVSGTDNLNRAACHACVLLPETSCEEFNSLLDRALLTGTVDQPGLAFFPHMR